MTRAERILSGDIRPDDYLHPPPEIVVWIDQHPANTGVTPEERQWTLDNNALYHHYAGREIACWRTEKGVIVFAVGAAEVSEFLRRFPVDQRPDVAIEYP